MKVSNVIIWAVSLVICFSGTTLAATPEEIDSAIQKGIKFLYSIQKDGNWEKSQTAPVKPNASGADEGQWGGTTALVTYALLASGEKPTNEKIVAAVEWLRKAKITGHYALGMRANVWLNLPLTPDNKKSLYADYRLLLTGISIKPGAKNRFFHDYQPLGNRIDLSCAQYGVLGLWAASQQMTELPRDLQELWVNIQSAWCAQQAPDGAWAYAGLPEPNKKVGEHHGATVQMTAAGVATLFITQEFLQTGDSITSRDAKVYAHISKGIEWIAKYYPDILKNLDLYAMYGVERIGVASGYKYLGSNDWFQSGADVIVKRQNNGNGSWSGGRGESAATSWAILFLSRGRAPVLANKLQYNVTNAKGESEEGKWNDRPRDLANATHWIEDRIERKLNWQIINLSVANIADLHDSSILYVTGSEKLSFTDKEKAVLKQYVEEGGLIIATADTGKANFSNSFRELAKQLFPAYEFSQLGENVDHPMLAMQNFPAKMWKRKLKIEGISNGSRLLMVLLPSDDISRTLQRRDSNRPEAFEFMANAFLYSVDKVGARFKGQTHVVRPNSGVVSTREIKVARLQYPGRWNPEPAGWQRLTAVMLNENKIKLSPVEIDLAGPAATSLKDYKIAHITGTGKFTLGQSQRLAIADFIKAGGLLIVDSTGGNDDFNSAMQAELSQMFPGEAGQLKLLPKDSPFYSTSPALPPVKYRVFTALKGTTANLGSYGLKGITIDNKLAVIYSSEDLSTALVGNPIDGINGYDPEVATPLMKRIIMMKADGKI